jgi:hypothetical protein
VTEIENEYGNVGIHYEMYINAVMVSSKKRLVWFSFYGRK